MNKKIKCCISKNYIKKLIKTWKAGNKKSRRGKLSTLVNRRFSVYVGDPVNEKWYLCKSKLERKWKLCCHVAGVVVMIFNPPKIVRLLLCEIRKQFD